MSRFIPKLETHPLRVFLIFALGIILPGTFPVLDATGVHLPAAVSNYRAPASVDNGQQNFTQEIRLQSSEPDAKLIWTTALSAVIYALAMLAYSAGYLNVERLSKLMGIPL